MRRWRDAADLCEYVVGGAPRSIAGILESRSKESIAGIKESIAGIKESRKAVKVNEI